MTIKLFLGRIKKYLVAILAVGALAFPAKAAKYALCVGINKYGGVLSSLSELNGCVNDSKYMAKNLVERGGWPEENIVLLQDDTAKIGAIREAMTNLASKAVSGDTFIFMHSSHGYSSSGVVALCAHNGYYWDKDLAGDLMLFRGGVKVVVIVDACYSAGLFENTEPNLKAALAKASAAGFDLAGRVSGIIDETQSSRKSLPTKGEASSITSSEIGWVTAAAKNEQSIDFGFYHTDEWLTNSLYGDECFNNELKKYIFDESYICGGTFLASSTWGLWNGGADENGDGFCDAYEFWQAGYDFCTKLDSFWGGKNLSFNPQYLHDDVLESIKLGRSGKENEPFAQLGENPSLEEISAQFEGAKDKNLDEFIKDKETYDDFKSWAQMVNDSSGEEVAGGALVRSSDYVWLAFAADSDKLIGDLETKDIEIAEFSGSGDGGGVEFSFDIAGVSIGEGANAKRIEKAFSFEGASSLEEGAFSSSNVVLESCSIKEGLFSFSLKPKAPSGSFFFKFQIK